MTKFKVTKKSMRPACDKHQCFYCEAPIGGFHKQNCVLVQKKVKIKVKFECEVSVPFHWSREQIEFHYAEQSFHLVDAIETIGGELTAVDPSGGDAEAFLDEG